MPFKNLTASIRFLARVFLLCVLCDSVVSSSWAAGPFEKGPTPKTRQALIEFSVAILPADPFSDTNAVDAKTPVLRRGEIVTLVISGSLKPGFHTYPMTERSAAPRSAGKRSQSIEFRER